LGKGNSGQKKQNEKSRTALKHGVILNERRGFSKNSRSFNLDPCSS
jgi:hypothetical protein